MVNRVLCFPKHKNYKKGQAFLELKKRKNKIEEEKKKLPTQNNSNTSKTKKWWRIFACGKKYKNKKMFNLAWDSNENKQNGQSLLVTWKTKIKVGKYLLTWTKQTLAQQNGQSVWDKKTNKNKNMVKLCLWLKKNKKTKWTIFQSLTLTKPKKWSIVSFVS